MQEGRDDNDDQEIAYLDAFLDLSNGIESEQSTIEIESILDTGVVAASLRLDDV